MAEIEAVQDFVDLMAWLSFLDECEESARTSFAGFSKRWESRRAAGLVGKPNAAKNKALSVVLSKAAVSPFNGVNKEEIALVPFVHKSQKVTDAGSYKRSKAEFQKMHPRTAKGIHGYGNPIQQPRKHN